MLWAFGNSLRVEADFRISLITWSLFPVGPYEATPLPSQWAALGTLPPPATISHPFCFLFCFVLFLFFFGSFILIVDSRTF